MSKLVKFGEIKYRQAMKKIRTSQTTAVFIYCEDAENNRMEREKEARLQIYHMWHHLWAKCFCLRKMSKVLNID